MKNQTLVYLLALALLLVPAANAHAADQAPDDTLKSKGLSKTGQLYLLPADANLSEWLRALRQLKAKADLATRKRTTLQRELDNAIATLKDLDAQNTQLTDKLDHSSKEAYASYNVVVAQVNDVRSKIREGIAFVNAHAQTIDSMEDPSDEYVALVLQYTDMMELLSTQYAALATDKDVIVAIDQVNATATQKVVLGPSERFKQELPEARKLRGSVNNAKMQFDMSGGVPHLPVTIDGSLNLSMTIDSGAALMTLTAAEAAKLGIHPGPQDPEISLQTADGKVTTGHVVLLKTVRLGQFTIENVECAIQPPESKDGDNLLGGSFFKHFVYKMDLAAGILHLSEITAKPTAAPTLPTQLGTAADIATPTAAQVAQGQVAEAPWMDAFKSRNFHTAVAHETADGYVCEGKTDGRSIILDNVYVPFTAEFVAMTDSTNLRIRYAKGELIFNWERDQSDLRFSDPKTAKWVGLPQMGNVTANEFATIKFVVNDTSAEVFVNGESRGRIQGDYAGMLGSVSIGNAFDSVVTVKSFRLQGGAQTGPDPGQP